MRVRFIPFALIVLLTVGACDSGGSSPDPTSAPVTSPVTVPVTSSPVTGSVSVTDPGPPHPSTPTVPADVPRTGPNLLKKGERPPVMPLEATQHTQRGAVAFGRFFELTIDWGYAVTSTTYMRHYYEPTCVTCKSVQVALDDAASKDRRFIGGRMTITSVTPRSAAGYKRAERSVVVAYQLTSVEIVNKDGVFINADPAVSMTDQVYLTWKSAGWVVAEMVPLK